VLFYRHKVLNSNSSTTKGKKKIFGAEDVAEWESVCPACALPWVQFPNIAKNKTKQKNSKMVRRIAGVNAT
jgi:hypothetical protein